MPGRLAASAARALNARAAELPALAWSFAYFFCLLCGYYILRPLRDEMGIAGGIENLPWVFTATFVVMLAVVPLFGWISARFPRRVFVPLVYWFFAANLLAFFALFESGLDREWLARAFFVWVSVYNLFVVSVFWSLMADLFSNEQARRLFGAIAAGGSAGAIAGPALTATLVGTLEPVQLLLLSAGFLGGAILCIHRLLAWARHRHHAGGGGSEREGPMGGSILAGLRLLARSPYLLGICLFVLLFTTLSTFLYFEQAHIVEDAFASSAERTRVFAVIDLLVNILTITAQLFVTGRLMDRLRLGWALALVPAAVLVGFVALALAPVLAVLVAFQVVRRAGNYAITRPAREVLFTVVGREAKYKAKNVIDTVVYRGGDAASGWVFDGLKGLGLSLSAIAWVAVPVAAVWIATAWLLGRRQEQLRREQ